MASIYKPHYTTSLPPGAERCKLQGLAAVRFIDGKGRRQIRPIKRTAAGERMLCEQACWWMKYTLPDGTIRREKGFRDKTATEQEAARREREALQAQAGVLLVDPRHLSAPLAEHIIAYVEDLERAGRAPKYYAGLQVHLERIAAGCDWQTLRHIAPDGMNHYLAVLKREGRSGKTMNEYLGAARAFCRWCIATRRLAGDPLASVAKVAHVERVYERRALTVHEAGRLLDVAGPRRLLYLVALTTGLRRSELRFLQWADLRMGPAEKTPCIALRAATTKARRADTIPLRPDVADELRAARPADALATGPVFPTVPRMPRFLKDLEAAGIAPTDDRGRHVDFHGLRVSYGTMLAAAGVVPRVAMELMRHTDLRLTMGVYTDPRLLDTSAAVRLLPSFSDGRQGQRAVARKTGTFGTIALNRDCPCPSGSISDHDGQTNLQESLGNRDISMGVAGLEPATSSL